LPKTKELVYLRGYVPAPEIVIISIMIFKVMIKVKNFLREIKRMLLSYRIGWLNNFFGLPVSIKPKLKLNPLTWSVFQTLSRRWKLRLNIDKFLRHRTRRYRRKRLFP
jgi:hypothetical protein